jgi:dimethylhistidine N-methyltransferase
MQEQTTEPRFRLLGAGREPALERFAAEVEAGLTSAPKTLPCAWFYDARGSRIFEEICELPEYYPTRAEEEILRTRAAEIAACVPPGASVVELGSGSAVKTRILLEELLSRADGVRYVPVDISRSMLEHSSRALLDDYPALRVLAIAAEYGEGLHLVRREVGGHKLMLWLGSNVGNLDRREAVRFLAGVRADLGPEDRLLIGIDLKKDRATLERAYDDAAGVTERFNKNLLARINRELGGRFDLDAFRHAAAWNEEAGRVEMHLVSARDQSVRIEHLGLDVPFRAGETIHTESSHKYSLPEIDALAAGSGFRVERRWLDRAGRFALQLFRPSPGPNHRAGPRPAP